MDIWDVVKAAVRRWHLAAPLLLAVVAASVWVGMTTSPDYRLTDHIAMIGPTVVHPEDETVVRQINPWSSTSLAEAVAIRLTGKALTDELRAAGHDGEWGVNVSGRQPWIELEVIADTPEGASQTMDRLHEIAVAEVARRQDEYEVPPEDRITTSAVEEGATVEQVTGPQRRAVVAVAGLGLLLSFGAVTVYDLMVRRREARRSESAAEPQPARARYRYGNDRPVSPQVAGDGDRRKPAEVTSNGARNPEREHATSRVWSGGQDREDPRGNGAEGAPPDDSTIVLPLSNEPWARTARSQGDPPH